MIGYIKLGLMVLTMTMGIFTIYGMIWQLCGFELTNTACVVLAVFAIVSEFTYIMWVKG